MTHTLLKLLALNTAILLSACAGRGDLAPSSQAAAVVQRQLDAYNARDLQAFVATYSEDVTVFRAPGMSPILTGKEQLSNFYRDKRFNLPGLRADLLHRIVVGNKVIDHERIIGVRDEPFEAVAAYVVKEGLIHSVWLFYTD